MNDLSNNDKRERDGLEIEKDEELADIVNPFNPEKIKVRTTSFVVDQIISRIDYEEIDLTPDFQRISGIWDPKRKSRLIESIMLRIPIPVFYVAESNEETWSVVDGVQRTSTIYDFFKEKFALSGLEYLAQLNNCRFSDLPRKMQRRISETQLVINIIESGTPEEVMFNIFKRINTGGIRLNGQEIRHALHPGKIRSYLKELASMEEFRRATDYSLKPNRMADRECILRFLAFYIERWEDYAAHDLDGYLGDTMNKINNMDENERLRISKELKKSMQAAFDIFGQEAFRKRYDETHSRYPISKALFESWSVGLARREMTDIEKLVKKRELLARQFICLLKQDSDFEKSISYSTGIPERVKKRFSAIDELIGGCL